MVPKDRLMRFPDKDTVLAFIREHHDNISKRDIARHFGIRGPDKVLLKKMLRELAEEGLIAKEGARTVRPADRLPSVQIIEYVGTDKHGDALAKPANWEGETPPPTIFISEKKGHRGASAMGPGDTALARLMLIKDSPPLYRAEVVRMLRAAPSNLIGVFYGTSEGGRLVTTDKKKSDEYWVDRDDVNHARDGEMVTATLVRSSASRDKMGPKRVRVIQRLGDVSSARTISMIAIHTHEIPHIFPDYVTAEAENAKPVTLGNRSDLREIPLITIDPVDARDHDDAIWAEADTDPKNKGGWHTIVAIADVAYYVRPGNSLDKEAIKRGNSCYFPDRVVPMLPEALSAGLCSLKPHEERACMAVHMWFDKSGTKLRHQFVRGLMKSHANVNYEQAQRALDGDVDDIAAPVLESTLKPLYGAYKALTKATSKREPLLLDLPERKIELSEDGHVKGIALRERLDTHKLVEEFMICANVCAAEELEKYKVSAMYRVHEEPPMDKIDSLRDFLRTLELDLTKGTVMRPGLFNGILNKVKDGPHEFMVNEVVLRSQTQAYYSPENMGHFGLALMRYAHFTSPIRRYSDLLVHRGLIRALKLGDDGLTDSEISKMEQLGEQLSITERRAMAAERDSTDRYMASYLSEHVGDTFKGRISGVTRFGLFVALEQTGGDGLIPISEIGSDYFIHEPEKHRLIGERYRKEYKLGDKLEVRLREANKLTGGLKLEIAGEEKNPNAKDRFGKGRRVNSMKDKNRRHSRPTRDGERSSSGGRDRGHSSPPRSGGGRFEDRPRSDRPHSDRPQSDRPRSDRPARPHADKPRSNDDKGRFGDKPRSDNARSDRPRSDRPRNDRPRSDNRGRPDTNRDGGGPGRKRPS